MDKCLRKITAHYAYSRSTGWVKRPVLTFSPEGELLSLEPDSRQTDARAGTEFFSGLLVPGMIECGLLGYGWRRVEKQGLSVFGEAVSERAGREEKGTVLSGFCWARLWKEGISAAAIPAGIIPEALPFPVPERVPVHCASGSSVSGREMSVSVFGTPGEGNATGMDRGGESLFSPEQCVAGYPLPDAAAPLPVVSSFSEGEETDRPGICRGRRVRLFVSSDYGEEIGPEQLPEWESGFVWVPAGSFGKGSGWVSVCTRVRRCSAERNIPLEWLLDRVTALAAEAVGVGDRYGDFRIGMKSGAVLWSGLDWEARRLTGRSVSRRML